MLFDNFCCFLRTQRVKSTQLKSQANQRPVSYGLDPLAVIKRHKGQEVTSRRHLARVSTSDSTLRQKIRSSGTQQQVSRGVYSEKTHEDEILTGNHE